MTGRAVHAVVLAAVLLGAFALRYDGTSFGLPILVHPDEAAVADPARRIAATGNLNPHTFLYPSFFIYAQASAYRLRYMLSDAGSVADLSDSEIYRTGRMLTVVFAVATVLVTYAAACAIGGPVAAIAAAALTAVSELHVANSLPITTDVPMAFFVVLAFWLSIRIHTEGARMRDYVGAGLCAGLATSTKYNGVVAVLPIVVAHLLTVPVSPRVLLDRRLVAAGVASILGFFVATPYALVDSESFFTFLRLQREAYTLVHPGADQAGTSYAFYFDAMWKRFGAAPFLVAALGVVAVTVRRPRLALILIACPAALFGFMGAYPVRFDRNIVALVSFAAIAAGCGLAAMLALARRPRRSPSTTAAVWIASTAVAAAIAYGGIDQLERSRAYTRLVTLPNTRWLAKLWIDENLPPGARIAREFYTPPIDPQRFDVTEVGYWGLIRTPQLDRYDYLIASSDDYGRFVQNAERYPQEAATYYALFGRYELIKSFVADWRTSTGPEIRVYRRPATATR